MATDYSTIFGKLFPLLFMMMGPIGLMPAFVGLTRSLTVAEQRKVARNAIAFAAAAITLAVALGAGVLAAWGATPSSLIVASGLLLLIAALKGMFVTPASPVAVDPPAPTDLSLALSPLAFPTMISPHAIGVLIVFVAFFPDLAGKATILAVALGVLVLNLGAMIYSRKLMELIGMTPLRILGAVFGVLQVALSIEIIFSGLSMSKLVSG